MQEISQRTLAYYQGRAQAFWEGTRTHDVSQNRDALLAALGNTGPYDILDLGCGPGRDVQAFSQLGHRTVGLDGCPDFVRMAQALSGCEIWCQDLLALDLPAARFDGVFANAVLFHVPSKQIRQVLSQLHQSLRDQGVLFCSNPRGQGQEGWQGERYGTYYSWPQWEQLLLQSGFTYLHHYYRPAGLPREQQPWLASLWRKAA